MDGAGGGAQHRVPIHGAAPGRSSKIFQWHRDSVLRPSSPLPLNGLQADCQANAPGVLSWNIALHDDDSLWVVPGSNRRGNTAAEQEVFDRPAQLADEPLPGGALLRAGRRRCRGVRCGDGALRQRRRGPPPAHVQRRLPGVRRSGARTQPRHLLEGRISSEWLDAGDGSVRFERFERLLRDEQRYDRGRPSGPSSNGTGPRSGSTLARLHPGRVGPHGLRGAAPQDRACALEAWQRSARRRCPTPTTRSRRWTTLATGGALPRSWSASPARR